LAVLAESRLLSAVAAVAVEQPDESVA